MDSDEGYPPQAATNRHVHTGLSTPQPGTMNRLKSRDNVPCMSVWSRVR